MREWFKNNVDLIKPTKWEKITMTFDWNNLSTKQKEMVDKLVLKYRKYFQTTQSTNTTP